MKVLCCSKSIDYEPKVPGAVGLEVLNLIKGKLHGITAFKNNSRQNIYT